MSLELLVVNLGEMSYEDGWTIQQAVLNKRIQGEIPDTLLLVEHTPTISVGKCEKWNKLHKTREEIEARGIRVHDSSRGGGTAYLGPGQLVGYTIMDITRHGGILPFLKGVEDVMITVARQFGVPAGKYDVMNPTTDKPYRATWLRKPEGNFVLATKGVGLRLKSDRLFAHHGFSLNVFPNKTYYDLIDPCGFPISEVEPTSLQEHATTQVDMAEVRRLVGERFASHFHYAPVRNLHEVHFLQYLNQREVPAHV